MLRPHGVLSAAPGLRGAAQEETEVAGREGVSRYP